MAKTVVRTDNLAGIVDGSKLVSARYNDGTDYAAVENGTVLKLDSIISNTRGTNGHVWKVVKPSANDKVAGTNYKLVLIASPELVYDNDYASLDAFENAAGADCLGYVLQPGDVFSVTVDAFATNNTPDTTTNKYIVLANTTKLTRASAVTNAFAELVAVEAEGGYTYYVLRVL